MKTAHAVTILLFISLTNIPFLIRNYLPFHGLIYPPPPQLYLIAVNLAHWLIIFSAWRGLSSCYKWQCMKCSWNWYLTIPHIWSTSDKLFHSNQPLLVEWFQKFQELEKLIESKLEPFFYNWIHNLVEKQHKVIERQKNVT